MIQKHKKPFDLSPSSFFLSAFEKYCPLADLTLALDLPCGFGRHSLYLSQKGYEVVCADYDLDVFRNRWFDLNHYELIPVLLNAKEDLPFKSESFGLITVVHFYTDDLFAKIRDVLKIGGIVIFESFGGQGENWRELPIKGQFRESLEGNFEVLYYNEKVAGPSNSNISVKMVAKKIC